ncbi:hypothetical protein ACWZHB_01215 [Nocardia sp. FBN12]|uniref:hypothetical protein n=1 Tax=Nocardia sp. FBN12 TaxID=3419766 RepID=UPI003D046B45
MTYRDHSWYVRQVSTLEQQLANTQRQHNAEIARSATLLDYITAAGLMLTDPEIRTRIESNLVGEILTANQADRCEDFRTDIVSLTHEVTQARNRGVDDTAVLEATLEAISKAVACCKRREIRAVDARAKAAQRLAHLIPE